MVQVVITYLKFQIVQARSIIDQTFLIYRSI